MFMHSPAWQERPRLPRNGISMRAVWWLTGWSAVKWPSAWPERVVAVEGPLADLAALESPGLPGVPGPLQLPG
jgi:hypothetical protein